MLWSGRTIVLSKISSDLVSHKAATNDRIACGTETKETFLKSCYTASPVRLWLPVLSGFLVAMSKSKAQRKIKPLM